MVQTIIRRRDLRAVTGYGITTIYEMIGQGRFPKPIPLGARAVGWLSDELEQWQQSRIAERSPTKTEAA